MMQLVSLWIVISQFFLDRVLWLVWSVGVKKVLSTKHGTMRPRHSMATETPAHDGQGSAP